MKKLLFIFALILVAITSNAQTSPKGDLDNDGVVSVSDVMELVGIILNGGAPQSYLTCPDNHHPHMIDLGLPSGTKWACCNVGADKPTAYGGYYAWGETEEKSKYNEVNYLYATGVDENGDGFFDDNHSDTEYEGVWQNLGNVITGTEYDVAHVKWGGSWGMPTFDQQLELSNNCTYEWTTMDGVRGGLITGPSGGSIFLPAAGIFWNDVLEEADITGSYWSSSLYTSVPSFAYTFFVYQEASYSSAYNRFLGRSVRPVYK